MRTSLLVLAFLCAGFVRADWVRPVARGLRVPNGAIVIDGDDADWARFAGYADHRITAAQDDHYVFRNADRGAYGGAADSSITACFAEDRAYLFVIADVHDDILVNDADLAQPFFGDDFELFVDANPPAARFATRQNANVRQLIVLPAYLNPKLPQGGVWQAETCPGVVFASRLRPWGYTVELQVPKALFPAWRDDPWMPTVGVDLSANDADAAGVDVVHPAIKGVNFLLSPGNHFLEPSKLGQLAFDDPGVRGKRVAPPKAQSALRLTRALFKAKPSTADALAQAALDTLPTADAAAVAQAAAASPVAAVHTAGLRMQAKRHELGAGMATLLYYAKPSPERAACTYALLALAERHSLPLDLCDAYLAQPDPGLRLTYLYAVGVNGDKTAVGKLLPVLKDANLRVRMMAALALGLLGDPTALDALRIMSKDDAQQYARLQATQAIARFGGK